MFMQRLITSLILIPLVLLTLFYGPTWLLFGVIILILLAAGRECWLLIPLHNPLMQWSFLGLLLVGLWCCGALFSFWLGLGLLVWLGMCLAIVTFPASQRYWGHRGVVTVISFILLPLFLQSMMHLYQLPAGKGLILYVLCLVWAADTGAYLLGKWCGTHKIIPQVSPGKSWEGALGGVILVLLVAVIGFYCFKPQASAPWFALALLTMVISVFGDLFVSILKRRCNLKDTGSLIPGHGGILDRLDSVIAAMPFFYFGTRFLF